MKKITMKYLPKQPLEMHKVKIVQKTNLITLEERFDAITKAGNNTFLLKNKDVFLDMLTDSGVNAMSDNQLAASMTADDAYAGSRTYYKLEEVVTNLLGLPYFLPAHQGRACEHIISKRLVKEGKRVPMNYHFTTTKSHIMKQGGVVDELIIDEGLNLNSEHPFKGNMDINKLNQYLKTYKKDEIAFLRMEAGTNLIGGQPFSLKNAKEVTNICNKNGIITVLDASLLQDNLYFIKLREEGYQDKSIKEITKELCSLFDIVYFSARKFGFAKGGGILLKDKNLHESMKEFVVLYEGFLTYGGMSTNEMEAIAVGLEETMEEDVISQGPEFIDYMAKTLLSFGVPVVTPPGGLGCHLDAKAFLSHVPQKEYPAGALATALYIISGVRGMERGTMSEQRLADGSEKLADMELVRLALPRRVFTLSQVNYAIDRIVWLYKNRELIGGLKFVKEPDILRFFFGELEPTSDWQEKLVKAFKKDFKDSY